jgi:hypothetical protein
MNKCFVIQPFDRARFDKLYEGIYEPAIRAADLEPYRVDRDPSVEIPIDAIEAGIVSAAVCLADITTDNPNVWYELGYAFAAGRQVVMVCGADRVGKKYPFDIQHRTIISYAAEAPSDFEQLKIDLTARLKAAVFKVDTIRELSEQNPLAPVDGLSQYELVVLAVLAAGRTAPDDYKSLYSLQQDASKAGITDLAYTLGLRKLLRRQMIDVSEQTDHDDHTYKMAQVTERGWDWIEENENRFVLKKKAKTSTDFDDDIPF